MKFLAKLPSYKNRRRSIKANYYRFLVNEKPNMNEPLFWKFSVKSIGENHYYALMLPREMHFRSETTECEPSVNQTIVRFSLRFSFHLSIHFKFQLMVELSFLYMHHISANSFLP